MSENATTQAPEAAPEQQSIFAPSWDSSNAPTAPKRNAKPKTFDEKVGEQAAAIAQDLGLDTRQDAAQLQKQPAQQDEIDPLSDAELEIAPGQKLKRGEVAKKLTEAQALEKRYKELESLSGTKLREAAAARKQADQQLQAAQRALQIQQELQRVLASGDPDELLRAVGYDPEKVRQQAIERAWRESQMSPEQREIERLKSYEQENARLKNEQQERVRQQQEFVQRQQKEQATNQAAQNLSKAFVSTAQQMNLPQTALTMQRFANMLSGARQRGLDPTFAELGQAVQAQYAEDVVGFLDSLSAEDFAEKIPPKTQQKLRQFFLRQTGNAAAPTGSLPSGPQAPRQRQQKYTGIADYNQFLETFRKG